MKKIISSGILSGLMVLTLTFASLPAQVGAKTVAGVDVCAGTALTSLGKIIIWASCTLIKIVVPFLFTLAVVGFIWGIIQYYLNPENEEKRKAGKSFMIWGIIALFVMVSMWGLVGVLTNTFGIQTVLPQVSQ